MSIIVEGPDGAGKTTLIRVLQHEFPVLELAPRFCTSTGGPIEPKRLLARVGSDHRLFHATTLYDRHPMFSEYVYSPALDRPLADGFLGSRARMFHRVIQSNCLVIFCLPPLKVVEENLYSEGAEYQMPGVMDNIRRIHTAYAVRANQYLGSMVTYDYTDANTFKNVREAINVHVR
ncbi:polynucleotide kinase [Gordonia phage Cleo]|nr:polynucleotide kinase [Gordonia phage Cleo]